MVDNNTTACGHGRIRAVNTISYTVGDSSYYRNCKNTKQKYSKIHIARDTSLYIKPSTLFILDFEHCIKSLDSAECT